MFLLAIGVILLAAALAGIEPMAGWSWWVIAIPFAMAAAWWTLSDAFGWTQRAAMGKADSRLEERRDRMRVAMGLDAKSSSRSKREQQMKRAQARQQHARLESYQKGQDELLRSSFIPGDNSQFADTVTGELKPATGNGD